MKLEDFNAKKERGIYVRCSVDCEPSICFIFSNNTPELLKNKKDLLRPFT